MRVLVCGGRHYTNFASVDRVLSALGPTVIIHGGCPTGADKFAGHWAEQNSVACRVEFADWGTYGPAAGPIRNQKMLEDHHPDLVVAFSGGKGTADMVRRAMAAGVRVVEHE